MCKRGAKRGDDGRFQPLLDAVGTDQKFLAPSQFPTTHIVSHRLVYVVRDSIWKRAVSRGFRPTDTKFSNHVPPDRYLRSVHTAPGSPKPPTN